MIPVKINSKKYQIKAITELTVSEFLELTELMPEKIDLVKYISWQTGLKLTDAFFAVTSKAVELAIGKFPDITKMPTPVLPYVSYSKKIETVGQRHQVEESNLKGYPLLVFTLAVAQAESMNIDDVHRLRDSYMTKPAIEILPAAFFFFENYRTGSSRGRNFLTWLLELIRTKRLRNKPGFIG